MERPRSATSPDPGQAPIGEYADLMKNVEKSFQGRMRTAPVATGGGRLAWLGVTVLGLALIGGCQSQQETYPVYGQFRFEDGTVPKFGEVEFFNLEQRINARGAINRDGSFTLSTFQEGDGAVAGKHCIVVMQHVTSPLTARAVADRKVQHDHGRLISSHYFDYRTTDLDCEVIPGENRYEWILKLNSKQTEDGIPKN